MKNSEESRKANKKEQLMVKPTKKKILNESKRTK
jgi:hypothetical protein